MTLLTRQGMLPIGASPGFPYTKVLSVRLRRWPPRFLFACYRDPGILTLRFLFLELTITRTYENCIC